MKAIGVVQDREINTYISGKDNTISQYLKKSFEINVKNQIRTNEEAIIYIYDQMIKNSQYYRKELKSKEEKLKFIQQRLMNSEFLPHIGGHEKMDKKIKFVSYMVNIVINMKIGNIEELDSDDYGNKRILTSGILYGQLFQHSFNNIINKDLRLTFRRELENFSKLKDYSKLIERAYSSKKMFLMERQISTGEWPAGRTKHFNVKAGVSQTLERKSRRDTIMYTQKIIMTSKQKGAGEEHNNPKLRRLHQTQFGFIDPFDTPDGKNIGKIKI